jgi:putative zinc finger/helix-turn-helix YgiT family protein
MKMEQKDPFVPMESNCECGGRLRAVKIPEYDFSEYVGFKVTVAEMDGLRCDQCGGETIDGRLVNAIMNITVVKITQAPRRLDGAEARYLRQNLGVTQTELASRMGIIRGTVAKWESGDISISPQHDYILRGLTLSALVDIDQMDTATMNGIMSSVFKSVRTLPPQQGTRIEREDFWAIKDFLPQKPEHHVAL